MKSGHFWPYLLALLAGYSLLLVTGCGVAPTQTMSPIPTPTSVNAPTPAQPEASVTPEPTQVDEETMDDSPIPEATSLIEQARQDLKSRLQIEDSRISLGSVEAVQWRDSSLGCPQPGRSYLTVITPGYLIVLEADGQPYEYHASENQVVYCDDSVPPYAGEEKPENTLIEAAKTDLARRLIINADQIEVRAVESRQWPDASLGCPQPDMMYAQVIIQGFQIILSVEGQEFDYRTDLQRAILCER